MRSAPKAETSWAQFCWGAGDRTAEPPSGAARRSAPKARGSAVCLWAAGAGGEGKYPDKEKTGALGEDWVKSAGEKLTNTHSVYYNLPCDAFAGQIAPRKGRKSLIFPERSESTDGGKPADG